MKKTLFIFFIFMITNNLFANNYCSKQNITEDLAGKWESEDSYYFNFKIKNSKLCIEIKSDSDNIKREVTDILIENDKLKSFSLYTSSTNGYVQYYDFYRHSRTKYSLKVLSNYYKGNMYIFRTK